jgi:hypothetical protein
MTGAARQGQGNFLPARADRRFTAHEHLSVLVMFARKERSTG